MEEVNKSKCDISKKLKSEFNLSNLPDELRISTMTINCNLNTLINVPNVSKYIDLSFGNIVCVQDENTVRTLIKLKKKNKKKKKKVGKTGKTGKSEFFNQASLKVEIGDKRRINIKVFKNGALQITGCKSMDDLITGLTVLCKELKKKKAVYNKKDKTITPVPFVEEPDNVNIQSVYNFKIRMINSNFHIGFSIDRDKLYNLLQTSGIKCSYEPCIHACVNIKYNYKNTDTVSVFVFESGAIIITGAKTRSQIVAAYEFITKFLYENYDHILKNNIDELLKQDNIQQMIKDAQQKEISTKEKKSINLCEFRLGDLIN